MPYFKEQARERHTCSILPYLDGNATVKMQLSLFHCTLTPKVRFLDELIAQRHSAASRNLNDDRDGKRKSGEVPEECLSRE
jgi:hypothetical protein